MAIKWVDRVATHPGRVQLTPVEGQTNIYDMERADEPTVAGTPINAANLNAMQKNMGLDSAMIVYVAVSGSDATGNGSSTAPYQTITKALSTIPKNMNGYNATVNIAAGSYSEDVSIHGFTNGRIILTGSADTIVEINSIIISGSYVYVSNIQLSVISLLCTQVGNVHIGVKLTVRGDVNIGIYANQFSNIVINLAEVNNTLQSAVRAIENSRIYANGFSGSGNANFGFFASGGVIAYHTNSLSASVLYSTSAGGRIYSGSQTSIPNY